LQLQAFAVAVYVIWFRELKKYFRERTRLAAMLGQPLLYLLIMGQGLRTIFQLNIEGFDYLSFMYPGVVAMTILFTSMFASVSIIWDREFGFLKEVLVAPVPRSAIAVGKALGGSTTALLQGTILLILAPLAGLTLSANAVIQILPLLFLLAFAITSFGTMVAAHTESMEGFHMIMNFIIVPLFLLSGAFFPIGTAPEWMQALMKLNPVAYGVDALRNIMFTDSPAKDFIVYYPLAYDVLVLIVFSAVMVTLSMLAFNRIE
jgi:ABC-2 type transport system permease protein